jgi:hypothetical protein
MAKEYKYDIKPCEFGSEKKASYIKDHTTIDAIVCYIGNANASDSWVNISNWQTHCFLKVKGEKEWKQYHKNGKKVEVAFEYKGTQIRETVYPDRGLFDVLHQLELPKARQKIEDKERLKKIDEQMSKLKEEKKLLEKRV